MAANKIPTKINIFRFSYVIGDHIGHTWFLTLYNIGRNTYA
jgi:hypothetical protein